MRKMILVLLLVGLFCVSTFAQVGETITFNNIVNQDKVELFMTGEPIGGYTWNIRWTEDVSFSVTDTSTLSIKFLPNTENHSVEVKFISTGQYTANDINKDGKFNQDDFYQALELMFGLK